MTAGSILAYPVTVSCSCVVILEIRNYHEQIAVFVPCHDGGSEILNPCGIKIDYCFVLLSYGPGDQKF